MSWLGYDTATAAAYDAVAEHCLPPGEADWWQHTICRLGAKDGARVLEIGAGTGLLMRALIERGYHVTGLEPSAAMFAQARQALPPDVDLFQTPAGFDAPVTPASFDAVILRQVLCHITNPAELFSECLSWLKPGAALMIVDGFWPASAWSEAERLAQPFACPTETAPLQRALETAGFNAVEHGPAEALNTIRRRAFPDTTPRYQAFGRRPSHGADA